MNLVYMPSDIVRIGDRMKRVGMSEARATRSGAPDLFRRIGFDPRLEAAALGRLAVLDVEGCRAAFGRLAHGLTFPTERDGRAAVLLLLDVLQRVNRRVHRASSDPDAFQEHRLALLEQFAGYEHAEDARRAFLPALNRMLGEFQTPSPAPRSLVERAQAYIEDHYNRRLSLSVVARHLHVSPNYLSRVFRREAGCTLTEFIHRVRLEHARLLLVRGGRSISEIAYLVGYQNYRDFYRNFVKYENASPRRIQQRLLKERLGGLAGDRNGDPP